MLTEFPDEGNWQTRLEDARTQKELVETYNRALNALEKGDRWLAQQLLGKIIGIRPDYKEAPRFLLQAVEGIDVEALKQKYKEAGMI